MTPEQTKILKRCTDLARGEFGRHESFGLAIEWILNHAKPGTMLVETGRYRGNSGEGQSTLILAILAQETGAAFKSIDFNPATVDLAKELLTNSGMGSYANDATLVTADSTKTISELTTPVCFCYLDSAQSPDLELQEATALVSKMTRPAAILIDDCGPTGGKSVLSVPFLEARGWKLMFAAFQRFLTLE